MLKVKFEFDSSQLLEQSLEIIAVHIHIKTFKTH